MAQLEIKIDSLDATEQRIFSAVRRAGRRAGKLDAEMCRLGNPAGDHGTGRRGRRVHMARLSCGTISRLPGRGECRPAVSFLLGDRGPSYFNYRKTSIYAGSNEIQRNIMAKMVLGL
jgi:alkylation response protein AidB-like acyl-CoA dehydrogenase